MPGKDLVDRLERTRQGLDEANVPGLMEDAAREIRRLRAEVDRLRIPGPTSIEGVQSRRPYLWGNYH